MNKHTWLLLIIGLTVGKFCFADCYHADTIAARQGMAAAIPAYEYCITQTGNDDALLKLARLYETGTGGAPKNIQRALLYYHLSSENGNASAQVGLSKLLTRLDNQDDTRAEIQKYLEKIKNQSVLFPNDFWGELLHPYTLLILAAENPQAKWYYQTNVRQDKTAATTLKNYPITPEKKQASYAEAAKWKQRKMMEMAEYILTADEFQEFSEKIYPSHGMVDRFIRDRAVKEFQERMEKEWDSLKQ